MTGRLLLVALIGLTLMWLLLGPQLYSSTEPPSWCDGPLMEYSRGCIGWALFDD